MSCINKQQQHHSIVSNQIYEYLKYPDILENEIELHESQFYVLDTRKPAIDVKNLDKTEIICDNCGKWNNVYHYKREDNYGAYCKNCSRYMYL